MFNFKRKEKKTHLKSRISEYYVALQV